MPDAQIASGGVFARIKPTATADDLTDLITWAEQQRDRLAQRTPAPATREERNDA